MQQGREAARICYYAFWQFRDGGEAMSDRTQLAIGRNMLSVPRVTKRLIEIAAATGLTALASLVILTLNNVLTARAGFMFGIDIWLAFIHRSDILGTIILTAMVTVAYLNWQRDQPKR
jgi:uncharacterized membrane protein